MWLQNLLVVLMEAKVHCPRGKRCSEGQWELLETAPPPLSIKASQQITSAAFPLRSNIDHTDDAQEVPIDGGTKGKSIGGEIKNKAVGFEEFIIQIVGKNT